MKLKTATLIAILGQIITFAYWQCSSFLEINQTIVDSYSDFEKAKQIINLINLAVGVVNSGTLVLFLCILYSKQK